MGEGAAGSRSSRSSTSRDPSRATVPRASSRDKKVGAPGAPIAPNAPGEASHFLPIVTVAVPVGETQPAEEISVTDSVADPFAPTENVTWLVP